MSAPWAPANRAIWAERLSHRNLSRLGLGLAIGGLGGFLAHLAGVPLAWMLGALFFCMIASVAGAPADVPVWLRMHFLSVIGLFLGESFSAADAESLARWPATLTLAVLYVPAGAALCYVAFRRLSGMERATSLLVSMPGGVTAIAVFAGEAGTDERRVALYHALRVALVVVAAPVVAFGWLGPPAPEATPENPQGLMSWADLALLIGVALPSIWLLQKVKAPVPYMLGPLLASALLRFPGVIEGGLPGWLVELSLVVTGSSIGSRFHGAPLRFFFETILWCMLGTALLMLLSLGFAFAAHGLLGVDLFAALLAYAPGGVAEMSLIALSIDADPAFVATHHMVRIFGVLFSLPLLSGIIRRLVEEDRRASGFRRD